MTLQRIGFAVLAVAAVGWLYAILTDPEVTRAVAFAVAATGLGFGLLVLQAYRDRKANAEDDHYSRTVQR